MVDFKDIPMENVLGEAVTTKPGYCEKRYIVYLDPSHPRDTVRVNTYYQPKGKKMRLCVTYDRGLCATLAEYKNLPLEYVESQAYGSYMDGAR